jgi:cytosine/adenosine deaminase-related metal-dependent hydrolase
MLFLTNATIVTGDGHTVVTDGSVVVDDGRIVDVRQGSISGGTGDEHRDLGGRLLVPGAVNSHSHGGVPSPLFASAAPALSLEECLSNLDKHLRGGTTTTLNVDGFNLPVEIEAAAEAHPINLKAGTTHFQLAFDAAHQADGSGLSAEHEQMTIEEMLEWGAVAISECGAGHTLAGGGVDYRSIPMAFEAATGVRLEWHQATALKYAILGRRVQVDAFDRTQVALLLKEFGLSDRLSPEQARDLIHETVLPSYEVALEGLREGARLGVKHQVPVMIHTSAPSELASYDAAEIAGSLLIGGHTNHSTFTLDESVACAMRLRELGALVEVCTLNDFSGARANPENMYALLERDLVDLAATDFAAGYWDNLYVGLGYAVAAGVVSLPRAVALATTRVIAAYPRLASERGELAVEKIADLVVCRDGLDQVETVFINGELVCEHGDVRRQSGQALDTAS